MGAVRLVFSDIEIDRNEAPASASAPPPMTRNHRVGERMAHREQHPRSGGVFEARDRGLRREATAGDRIPTQQQLVHRIIGESVGIIPVRMATRDGEDPLGEQVADPVRHTRGRPRIGDRRGEGRQQAELVVGRLEHDRARPHCMRPIERGDDGPIGHVRKQDSLCYRRLVQRNRLRVGKGRLVNSSIPVHVVSGKLAHS